MFAEIPNLLFIIIRQKSWYPSSAVRIVKSNDLLKSHKDETSINLRRVFLMTMAWI